MIGGKSQKFSNSNMPPLGRSPFSQSDLDPHLTQISWPLW